MNRINILGDDTAQLIAAGEVVENPASVVKELLENSIDAKATRITVEIKNGGVKYIKISDNGHGIYREDLKIAFLRHTTSKVKCAQDVTQIASLGFRGEALASICAVSRVEVTTKAKEESVGSRLAINGGEYFEIEDAGCGNGTVICIKDIFFNTPARMKFLKKDITEGNKIASVIDKLALSHPEIFFKFIRDGKQCLTTPGDGKISSAIYSVYGKDFFEGTVPMDYELNGVKITGFISKPEKCKSNKNMQIFFINGRFVKDKLISAALTEGFKNSVMVGKVPYCVMYLKIPYELVDVNVHPSKTEIKFANEKDIFKAVYYGVKTALNSSLQRTVPISKTEFPSLRFENFSSALPLGDVSSEKENQENQTSENFSVGSKVPLEKEKCFSFSAVSTANFVRSLPNVNFQKEAVSYPETNNLNKEIETFHIKEEKKETSVQESFFENQGLQKKTEIIGEIFGCYLLCEQAEKIILIDKHAAHERIIFEKLKSNSQKYDSQVLMEPACIVLEKEEYSAVTENLDLFLKSGYEIDDFGMGTIRVRSIPLHENVLNLNDSISEMANYILTSKEPETKKLDWLYHNIACRCAIKAGKESSKQEIYQLIKTLSENPDIRYCPHGRPIYIEITKKFIEKQFGRI